MDYWLPAYIRTRPRTRLVCTLGPASCTRETIEQLVEAGMSVARINLSHGTPEGHAASLRAVREVAAQTGQTVAVLADLPGPKYRLGVIQDDGARLAAGDRLTLAAGGVGSGAANSVTVHPPGLHRDVRPGDAVLIDDGAIRMSVEEVAGDEVRCRVIVGGSLRSRKSVATPGRSSRLPYLTEETRSALDFAVAHQADFIGLSYVRGRHDLEAARRHIGDRSPGIQLIAKIEVGDAVDRLESILEASDGVMVARGDLGVELPIAQVPGVQKRIITRANELGKVVITATQMLESMIQSPNPTRAEIADIANAVLDGTDAIMLSAETSIGKFPVEAVRIMAEAAREAEKLLSPEAIRRRRAENIDWTVNDAIAFSACSIASETGAKAILAFTESGSTAARVSSFRPRAPILALYRNSAVGRKLALRWGVTAMAVPRLNSIQWMFHEGSRAAIQSDYAAPGEYVLAVVGMPPGVPGNTNLLRVIRVPEPRPKFSPDAVEPPSSGDCPGHRA